MVGPIQQIIWFMLCNASDELGSGLVLAEARHSQAPKKLSEPEIERSIGCLVLHQQQKSFQNENQINFTFFNKNDARIEIKSQKMKSYDLNR